MKLKKVNVNLSFPFGLLGVLFVILKLTHVVAWSWLWVLAPFWIPISFVLVLLVVIFVLAVLGLT